LRVLASGRALLAFDFDGTLAPLADHPHRARMTARTHGLLAAVARLYPCVVISGRARHDLVRRLRRVPVAAMMGSHGAEADEGAARGPRSRVRSWARRLRRRLAHLRGVVLEVKPHGVAVHYREAEDKRQARAIILGAVTVLADARHIHGKDVVEVLPTGAPNKGDALAAIRRRLKPTATLYVGDDVTDEDAFSSAGPGGLLPVRVGHADATAALFRLDDQGEVEMLLHALIILAQSERRARVRASIQSG
jgi:trehalose 6-phosphate phosphatase